jgi:sugar lactone lactonase YvrE
MLIGLFLIMGISVLAIFVGGARRKEPGASLQYNINKYTQIDPALIKFAETGRITSAIPELRAITAGSNNNIYLTGKNALEVYTLEGTLQEHITLPDTPNCLAVSKDGTVFLGMPSHVVVLDSKGNVVATWAELGGHPYITSIAIQGQDIFVADAGNRVVLRYDQEGKQLAQIGEKDEARDIPGLVIPSPYFDLAVNAEDALWVVNPGRLGLEQYRNNGDLVRSWYTPSMKIEGFTGCCNPTHIAFQADGSMVTAEKGLSRIKIYDSEGKFDCVVTTFGAEQDVTDKQVDGEQASLVRDIAVDARNRILVLDAKQKAVLIFERKEEA